MDIDIRWKQRFANYEKAFLQLKKFIDKAELNELEEQGMVKAFEYTYELGWNVLKDFLEYQGIVDLVGSRDTIRAAFKEGVISDGDGWMHMISSRNQTAHTYNRATAEEIAGDVRHKYFKLFSELAVKMQELL